jgi:hypothetical protein
MLVRSLLALTRRLGTRSIAFAASSSLSNTLSRRISCSSNVLNFVLLVRSL